jgi:potassium channel subfamily K
MQHEHKESNQPPGSQQQTEAKVSATPSNEENTKKRWWNMWKKWEGEETDWWFASTGIPLLAATLGPLANVSSIAALVTPWRQRNIINGEVLTDFEGVPFGDPRW